MDKAKFYLNARGSLYEVKSHLIIAKELAFIKNGKGDDVFNSIEELSLGINNLIKKPRRLKEGD
jgi:four helix bundle protein